MDNETDDFKQALRLLHVVRAWAHSPGTSHDPAREDPLYPLADQRVLLFGEVNKLLERYPYQPPA